MEVFTTELVLFPSMLIYEKYILTNNRTDRHTQCTSNHGGECSTMGSRDTTLVSTSTLVAYQVKPVSLPPATPPHGMTVGMF